MSREEGRSDILDGRTLRSEDEGQEVKMSILREGSMKCGEGMGRGRSEWRVETRDVLGPFGTFLHGEMLACLALLLWIPYLMFEKLQNVRARLTWLCWVPLGKLLNLSVPPTPCL